MTDSMKVDAIMLIPLDSQSAIGWVNSASLCDAYLRKPVSKSELFSAFMSFLPHQTRKAPRLISGSSESFVCKTSETGAESLTNGSILTFPPLEQMKILHEMAVRGDITGIKKQVARLERLYPESRAFAQILGELARGFQDLALMEFVTEGMDRKKAQKTAQPF